MQYRQVGKTGMEASVVGLGTEHLDNKPYEVVEEVVDAAIERGINIFDLFMPGDEVRGNIGRALKGRRDRVLIQGHIGSVDLKQQYDISRDLDTCKRYFEKLLQLLDTDYIDFGMLFFMDSDEDWDASVDNGLVDYAQTLKRQGVVRAIGASSHNPEIARRVVESGVVDMIMFSINPAFDMMPDTGNIETMLGDAFATRPSGIDPARAALYQLCQRRDVGITVMKTLGAGKLLSPDHTPFESPLTAAQCIRYALDRPAVVSTLVGCKSRAEVEEATAAAELPAPETEYVDAISRLRSDAKGGFKGACVYCNHCLPCPSEIDIASVNKYLDIASLDESAVPPSVAQHYKALKRHGSDCVACGNCEARCPFSVPVIDNMSKAARLFGE